MTAGKKFRVDVDDPQRLRAAPGEPPWTERCRDVDSRGTGNQATWVLGGGPGSCPWS